MKNQTQIPVIDVSSFLKERKPEVAKAIARSCEEFGFFCISNHGIALELQNRLAELSHQFFAQPEETKLSISMTKGGVAWRGFFPVGNELTSGKPDLKEGLYFGDELGPEDSRVQAGLPLHGQNQFPAEIPEFKTVVLEYISELTQLGHVLMEAISIGLKLPTQYFHEHYTRRPTSLFRIFHYPPLLAGEEDRFPWGVGEHTDYGLLTILNQDQIGGLEIKTKNGDWISIPADPNVFVCNVGDMLDFISQGRYRSAPHRVKNTSGRSRYSYPFFFDPDFEAKITPLPVVEGDVPKVHTRWDQQDLYSFEGTYGQYLIQKVSKVFPELKSKALGVD